MTIFLFLLKMKIRQNSIARGGLKTSAAKYASQAEFFCL